MGPEERRSGSAAIAFSSSHRWRSSRPWPTRVGVASVSSMIESTAVLKARAVSSTASRLPRRCVVPDNQWPSNVSEYAPGKALTHALVQRFESSQVTSSSAEKRRHKTVYSTDVRERLEWRALAANVIGMVNWRRSGTDSRWQKGSPQATPAFRIRQRSMPSHGEPALARGHD